MKNTRPSRIYLSHVTACCSSQLLIDDNGVFRCPCDRDFEEKAQRIIKEAPDQCEWPKASYDTLLQDLQWCYDRLVHIKRIHDDPGSLEGNFGISETLDTLSQNLPRIRDRYQFPDTGRYSIYRAKQYTTGPKVTQSQYNAKYKKLFAPGSSGVFQEGKGGYINSFREQVDKLNADGYRDKKFCNGGDDDVLVVDHTLKEYGFFEGYEPINPEQYTNLQEMWEKHL